jgi:hypothetical protein
VRAETVWQKSVPGRDVSAQSRSRSTRITVEPRQDLVLVEYLETSLIGFCGSFLLAEGAHRGTERAAPGHMSKQDGSEMHNDILPPPKEVKLKSPWVAVGACSIMTHWTGRGPQYLLSMLGVASRSNNVTARRSHRLQNRCTPSNMMEQTDGESHRLTPSFCVAYLSCAPPCAGGAATVGALCMMIYASKKVQPPWPSLQQALDCFP